MKKILTLSLITVLLLTSIVFADSYKMQDKNDELKKSIEEINEFNNIALEYANNIIKEIEKIQVKNINSDDNTNGILEERIFVTEIAGPYYEDSFEVPNYLNYVYVRPSDEAIFKGRLSLYENEFAAKTYDPTSGGAIAVRGLYEGYLTLVGYLY